MPFFSCFTLFWAHVWLGLRFSFVSVFFGEEVDYSCFGRKFCVVFGLGGYEVFVAFFDGFGLVVNG